MGAAQIRTPLAQRAVQYDPTLAGVKAELASFDAALANRPQPLETFMTAASPGVVTTTMLRAENNPDYPTDRDYVLDEDFMKAARKLAENKKLESKLDYSKV